MKRTSVLGLAGLVAASCALAGCNNSPAQAECEPVLATLPDNALGMDLRATFTAQLLLYHGACPAPGSKDETPEEADATGDVVSFTPGQAAVELGVNVKFSQLAVPPGPLAGWCGRVIYKARTNEETTGGRYQGRNARSKVDVRLAHQDSVGLIRLRPFGNTCLKLGPQQGIEPDAIQPWTPGRPPQGELYDTDGDGIPNLAEIYLGLRPHDVDRMDAPVTEPVVTVPGTNAYVFGGYPDLGGPDAGPRLEMEHPPVALSVEDLIWDRTEVTNRQYRVCLGTVVDRDGVKRFACTRPEVRVYDGVQEALASDAMDLHPVVGLTNRQAREFCQTRNGDLPTEVEWEHAARSTPTGPTLFPWPTGMETTVGAECTHAVFTSYYGDLPIPCAGSATLGLKQVADADENPAREEGNHRLLDMAGNAAEWTRDNFVLDAHDRLSAGLTPPITVPGSQRFAVRGGSYRSGLRQIHAQARAGVDDFADTSQDTLRAVGLRCTHLPSP